MMSRQESMRRDKHDTMMAFIILKLLYESFNKEEVRKRAEEYLIMGRFKLIDQALYEMARNRRAKKECPSTPPQEEEKKHSSATGKRDSGKRDSGKTNSGKADFGKADAGKADPGKTDSGKADPGANPNHKATSDNSKAL